MLIVDAQVHLWQRVAPGSVPQRPEPFRAAELLALMDECGVDRVVLAPTSWSDDGDDGNDVVVEAVAKHPDRFRAVGVLALRDPKSRDRLTGWRGRGLIGFCLRFHHKHLAPLLTDGSTDWVWPAAEQAGVPVTVNAPGQLAHIGRVARDHPRLKIAIDHLGLGPAAEDPKEAVDELVRLAAFDNVVVKADGLPNHSSVPYPFEDLHPHVCRALEAFGPKRFLWGSDLTRSLRPGCSLSSNYRQAIGMFTEHLACLTAADRELVMGKALCDWMGWP